MKKIIFLIVAVFLTIVIAIMAFTYYENTYIPITSNNTNAEKVLKVVGDIDYVPLAFLDEEGKPTGHDVDLIYRVANEMDMKAEIDLMPWPEAVAAFKKGEYDVLITVAYVDGREEWLRYSIPVTNDHYTIFSNKKQKDFHLIDLSLSKIAVLEDDGCVEFLKSIYDLQNNIIALPSTEACFRLLSVGGCDYVIAPETIGMSEIKKYEYKNIFSQGDNILSNIFCFATQPHDKELLLQINDALSGLKSLGLLRKAHNYWLVSYKDSNVLISLLKQHSNLFMTLTILMLFIICLVVMVFKHLANGKLRELVYIDRMTGVKNRVGYDEMVDLIDEKLCRRESIVFGIMMFDLNGLKKINDGLGHKMGDKYIIESAKMIERSCPGLPVYRIGGDEFVVIVGEKTIDFIEEFSKTFQRNIRVFNNTSSFFPNGISVAQGYAIYDNKKDSSFSDVYKRADIIMYRNKQESRNPTS